jgi:dihydroxyacetone kinase-like protein
MNSALITNCIAAVHAAVLTNESDIESLDRAIGDGDHFINVKRGCEVLAAMAPQLQTQAPPAAFNAIGMKLMSTIGGASGPLLASFFIAMGKSLGAESADGDTYDGAAFARAFALGVDAIKTRGKADLGEKTMLDVLIPVARLLTRLMEEQVPRAALLAQIKDEAERGMRATRDMIATKGRAHFLGERAIGHIDPGSKTCQVAIHAICDQLQRH